MSAALYDPEHGYYAREVRQVGRAGDFFTSVSVGPVFGALLARRFLQWWETGSSDRRWRILELGAHDGTLAEDILSTLRSIAPEAFRHLEYVIIEPLPNLSRAQRERLSGFGETVTLVRGLEELDVRSGIAFGNELLDALPFHVIEWHGGSWTECHVGWMDGRFEWITNQALSKEVAHATEPLKGPFPEGYRTEIRTGFPELLASLADVLGSGLLIWTDYGFARPDYYSADRTRGTLRTFRKHQAGENPLVDPGTMDITAHVDFSHVAEAAIAIGMTPACFSDQGSWLTRLAAPWLQSMENRPDPSSIRQLQTLIHPSHLGNRFHVLELALNEPSDSDASVRSLKRLDLLECIRP